MNRQEEIFFNELTESRTKLADALDDPAARGFKKSVSEKYSDQAHFIYELLQNADDVKATNVKFILEKERLVFIHNGTKHFTLSNPKSEGEDTNNGLLGDINAITSVANSNKTNASIGKFGVGFKAVFQYTQTPHIYDPEFKFKIERFLVPVLLENDFPKRKKDETVFVFPFDHNERTPKKAYEDISDKLRGLTFPLLFMNNLVNVEFVIDGVSGSYSKKIKDAVKFRTTTAELLNLTKKDGDDTIVEKLWLFSRTYQHNFKYSVGFFVSENGRIKPINEPAFCFFPTKETTNLNFVIHAPFLLTDSREGIRAGIDHNNKMIELLASLSADSFEYLRDIGNKKGKRIIDDGIINIIPIDEDDFSDPSNKQRVSFLPFYNRIKDKFSTSVLIPTEDGYVASDNAYWASVPQIAHLFSNEQLADIVCDENAKWAFPSLGRDETSRSNDVLFEYIDSIINKGLDEDDVICGCKEGRYYDYLLCEYRYSEVIGGITAEFIEKQDISWLHKFYKWISTDHRREMVMTKPIFLNQGMHAVAAYDEKDQTILFLPVNGLTGYETINEGLLENEDTQKFIRKMGIGEPSLRDQIYNIILPQYTDGADIDTEPHFLTFFDYYCACANSEVNDFIELIKEYAFLEYVDNNDGVAYRAEGQTLYMPTQELLDYFEINNNDVHFVSLEHYKVLVGEEKEDRLLQFLLALGVKDTISILKRQVDRYEDQRYDLPNPWSSSKVTWEEPYIEGCEDNLAYIEKNRDKEKTLVLWNILVEIIEKNCNGMNDFGVLLQGEANYYYYRPRFDKFESLNSQKLKTVRWLMDKDGNFVAANELFKDTLSNDYDQSSLYAKQLIEFLEIKDSVCLDDNVGNEIDENLTDEQKEKIELANILRANGIENADDLNELIELKRKKDAQKQEMNQRKEKQNSPYEEEEPDLLYEDLLDDAEGDDEINSRGNHRKKPIKKDTADVIKDIARRACSDSSSCDADEEEDVEIDNEELIPSVIDFSKKIERAKDKSAAEIGRITYLSKLQNKAISFQRYSFGWFKALLELEEYEKDDSNSKSREISISFSKVEREPNTTRTLILKHPNRYIPQYMEELADIPLILHMEDQTKTVAIEVSSVKAYTLKVKLKKADLLDDLDLSAVTSTTIDAKSPTFLMKELRKRIGELDFDDNYNLQDNLCKNIDFVFGPPGTGKTTYLAKDVVCPLMKNEENCRLLVLAPTNKSADVLTQRIMSVSGTDKDYEKWLVRFGTTADEGLEQSPVYKDKTFDIRNLSKSITITTIARFPYDYFMPEGTRLYLYEMNWDYIIIDEASMIPLANIIYPLYKKTPKKFVIAGDPFQIEPITAVDLWKNENIYTLVRLDSFDKPNTIPYKYNIKLLKKQYRSIPEIGEIFSVFSYGGVLQHYRKSEDQKPLNIKTDYNIKTLNIIKFPVSKYESIYRCKRLQHGSPYQVYSAIFAFEYVRYLSSEIAKANADKLFKIGIIAPYRAQADIIDKLLAREQIPKEVDIQVGTIHGFQGDECDLIFVVFNSPPTISSSSEMFLNKQNIVNVSISRARDYLFILMPDDNTENIDNMFLIKRIEKLIHRSCSWNEISSSELEKHIFGDAAYLENNVFSTSHQSVNVYGLPEKKYEIRAEESALDIQIHTVLENEEAVAGEKETLSGIQLGQITPLKPKMAIEQSRNNKKEYEYSSKLYNAHLYLLKDAKLIFKDCRKFTLIEGDNNDFKVNMNGGELFRLENKVKQNKVQIYLKGKVLGALNLQKGTTINYVKHNREFWLSSKYENLPNILETLSKMDKKSSLSDEELIEKYNSIIYA